MFGRSLDGWNGEVKEAEAELERYYNDEQAQLDDLPHKFNAII